MIFVIFIALNLTDTAIFQQMSMKGQLLLTETVCICFLYNIFKVWADQYAWGQISHPTMVLAYFR